MPAPFINMNVFEAILARRSVRNFTSEEVQLSCVNTLLEAAVRAPTAHHSEPWVFTILQDKSLLKQVSEHAKPLFVEELRRLGLHKDDRTLSAFSKQDFNVFYNAGTLIVIGAVTEGPLVLADCWLAAENLMLAALTMGLGSCVIGASLQALNMPEVKRMIGLPAEFTAVAPIIVGYPSGDTAPVERKRPVVLPCRTAPSV